MADRKVKQDAQGTFAQLYDVQEQMSRRGVKPLGRPPQEGPTQAYHHSSYPYRKPESE